MKLKYGILTTLFSLTFLFTQAQTGKITGVVIDKDLGETVISAEVSTTDGAGSTVTDFDGNFVLNLPPGVYTLKVSSFSYADEILSNIEVKAGAEISKKIYLAPSNEQLGEVVIEAKSDRNTENAIILMQKKSSSVMDGISSQQIKRAGDSDAAGAIKRVTGVAVEGGKYVSVRGLGDRYSKTLLNGVEIPSLDPEKNSVQMDMFPTNLMDNMLVYKTFSPDKPADFTGGLINLVTKDYPEKYTFSFSSSLGMNTQTTFNNNFLTYDGGSMDWLGMDDGTRATPAGALDLPQNQFDFVNDPNAIETTKQFRQAAIYNSAPNIDQSYAISVGNKKKLFGKDFGFLAAVTYKYTTSGYENGQLGRYTNPSQGLLIPNYELGVNNFSENRLWGVMLNGSMKLNDRNRIGVTLLHNQNGVSNTQQLHGLSYTEEQNGQQYWTEGTSWTERFITSGQLKGTHTIGTRDLKLNWISSLTSSGQSQPDLRFFAYNFNDITNDYQINSAAYNDPARFDRLMSEINTDNKVDLEIPFLGINDRSSKFQVGGRFLYKDRDFTEYQFDFIDANGSFNGNPNDFFAEENVIEGLNDTGYYALSNRQLSNTYNGTQMVSAGYVMVDLPLTEKFKLITGVRYEYSTISVVSENPRDPEGLVEQGDFLPSVNAMYDLSEKSKFRGGYNRTLARPTFRELAPFSSYLFAGDYVLVGNPNLDRTIVDNLDIRYEAYPSLGTFFSVSGFYKEFTNPIERKITAESGNLEVSFVNTPKARIYGSELEVRQDLGFMSDEKNIFKVGGNFTYMFSQTTIDESEFQARKETDPDASRTRPMFGQSPYILNAYLTYSNKPSNLTTTLSFNQFGERLSFVSRGGVPDVYEQPRPSLDFTAEKGLGEKWTLGVKVQNILNPDVKFTHDFDGEEFIFGNYTTGTRIRVSVKYLF